MSAWPLRGLCPRKGQHLHTVRSQHGEGLRRTGAKVCLLPTEFTDDPLKFLKTLFRFRVMEGLGGGNDLLQDAPRFGNVTQSQLDGPWPSLVYGGVVEHQGETLGDRLSR